MTDSVSTIAVNSRSTGTIPPPRNSSSEIEVATVGGGLLSFKFVPDWSYSRMPLSFSTVSWVTISVSGTPCKYDSE